MATSTTATALPTVPKELERIPLVNNASEPVADRPHDIGQTHACALAEVAKFVG